MSVSFFFFFFIQQLTDRDLFSQLLAIMYASVSASMAIEQNGLPRIASGDGGREIWNGDSGFERLEKFRQRLVEVQEGP
jgi:hypothetical protein